MKNSNLKRNFLYSLTFCWYNVKHKTNKGKSVQNKIIYPNFILNTFFVRDQSEWA